MEGTNFQRVLRVALDLVLHPRFTLPYLRRLPLFDRTPIGEQLPWFSYAAIKFLEKNLRPTMSVVEWGGGGSTIFFANRTASVFCIESNLDWAQAINSKLSELGIRTVSVEVHDFDLGDSAGFAKSPFVRAIKSRRPDIIVIDGYEESVPLRPICFSVAEELIAPGGMIIVDDSWRYPIIRESSNAKHWREFRSVGPCRYGVTTTDIHFY